LENTSISDELSITVSDFPPSLEKKKKQTTFHRLLVKKKNSGTGIDIQAQTRLDFLLKQSAWA